MSIEYFFKGYSLKYARSGFENHFLPGNGISKSKNSFPAKGRGSVSPMKKGAGGEYILIRPPFPIGEGSCEIHSSLFLHTLSQYIFSHFRQGKYRLFLSSYLPFNQSFKLSSVPS